MGSSARKGHEYLGWADTPRMKELRSRAREFAEKEILPVAEHHDRTATFPHGVLDAARKARLTLTSVPKEYGGPGYGALQECVIAEELGYACSGIWTALGIGNLATLPLVIGADKAQRKEWLGRIGHDGQIPAFGLTEPGGGSDVLAMRTRAERVGDYYVINGSKRYISNIGVADFLLLFARTGDEPGPRSLSVFVVPKGTEGFAVTRHFDKSAHRCYQTSELEFHDMVVPAANRIGAEGQGFAIATATLDHNRPAVGSVGVGVARRALAEATAYATEREAFGRPIAEHQAVGHQLAGMAIATDAARLLCLRSAAERDAGMRNTISASMAKTFATDTAMNAATAAVQIFGASGIMRDNPVEKLLRDAKVLQVYEGTNEIQRNVIVRELLRQAPRVAVPARTPLAVAPRADSRPAAARRASLIAVNGRTERRAS